MRSSKELPLKIQELLKAKGWTWPPGPSQQSEMEEAARQAAGSLHIEPNLLEEVMKEYPWFKNGRRTS
jgi:hypothetical protein